MLVIPPAPTGLLARATGVDVADVFSADTWTGTGATQSITNGVDISGEGGLVWMKSRSNAYTHTLHDSERGSTKRLRINTDAETTVSDLITSFNSDGFTLGADAGNAGGNQNTTTYAGWTFRKAPGFFDVVTYTGNGANRTISHNLGAVPGMIIIKDISSGSNDWIVYHRGNTANPETDILRLNTTAATFDHDPAWQDTAPTDSVFSVGTYGSINANTESFVAYLFGHDTDGIIQCGSYTGNGSSTGPTVSLGWEPQFLMVKRSDSTGDWRIYDSARDASNPRTFKLLPNSSAAEDTAGEDIDFNATSFQLKSSDAGINANTATYIYMAIKAED